MEKLKNRTEKVCSFYVSDLHFVTMILPYINKELNEKANIVTVLEKNVEDNIKMLISKLNLKNEDKILNIDWKESKGRKYLELNRKLKEKIKKENDSNIIFVSGSKEYIDFTNQNINKWMDKNNEKGSIKQLKIINCYEITEFNSSIHEILETHSKILNTSGERYIYEVFEGYVEEREMG